MNVLVKAKNVTVQYKSFTAVNKVFLTVNSGQILAIIGPNGSGKTSLLECIEGLRRPAEGEILVFGKNPQTQRKEIYKKMGVQLQETQYPRKLKVREVCRLFASFYQDPADWRVLLRQLGLAEKEKSTIAKLSGGEKQRLSIVLALLPKPELLMLDELTTGLDPEARRSIWNSLKIVRDSGIGVVLVSHYMEEVEYLADRVCFMQKGEVLIDGTVPQMREFAAGQLGSDYKHEWTLEEVYLQLVEEKCELSLGV